MKMGRKTALVLYGVLMVAIIVVVDTLFFRDHFLGRLIVNVAIVLVFGVFYLLALRRN
jgi:hypothetical protein